jgi:hypothetical protein|tara:strand:- start:1045 stop:1920 length:876 start_codon:yes stop_codon:yes gene_type:complete
MGNKSIYNPYASALDGLKLVDPVSAFFDFCREREKIRMARESGGSPPWSDDPIFQKGRFLNVFREDDRGSRAIIRFTDGLDKNLTFLVQALFFARWCNRQETLDKFSSDILSDPNTLKNRLQNIDPWFNHTAYPVERVHWEGKQYERLDAATALFAEIKVPLSDTIREANGDVIKATNAVNDKFRMQNDFPIFMAIIDLAWFRPDVIDPASHVPTGIGAVAYLDRLQEYFRLNTHQQTCDQMIKLQKQYWPEAKREFFPIDIEYLSCECRKYYSYVNGTKLFEGKNFFSPR